MRPVHRSILRTLVSLLLTVQFTLQPLSVMSPPPPPRFRGPPAGGGPPAALGR